MNIIEAINEALTGKLIRRPTFAKDSDVDGGSAFLQAIGERVWMVWVSGEAGVARQYPQIFITQDLLATDWEAHPAPPMKE